VYREERVGKGADKLARHINAKQQGRLDGFFTANLQEAKPAVAGSGKGKEYKKRIKSKVSWDSIFSV
jgi:flap endonuclease-1